MNTVLKWVGSKVKVMAELKKHLPAGDRLVEPFAGSCAVMMNTDYPAYLVADINPDLINLYRVIAENSDGFISCASGLFSTAGIEAAYYSIRHEFNHSIDIGNLWRAVYFLYLNRHGYRGACRYNKDGGFNVSYGNYKKPVFPENEIRLFAEKAQRAEFICADFTETLKRVKSGDVVYCDPPYHGTFSQYHKDGFNADQHYLLASTLTDIAERHPVIVSNSDTLLVKSLYRGFDINRINAPRSIGVAAGNSKKESEIIAVSAGGECFEY
ncbi:DNA adenine methylase [Erwinia pyrifoliae]|uniref:Site-specific DNA-methyltransferase (adenine-specific) n=1 Tax=Erwinia pyrifoliae TaxID=79967 RepID=A0ABY5X487_ERWPY|nr:DNA adenine methylase [Erwinia pyrifoliae]MCT2388606.1 DNA adenine methylase [Erwinia pyrifoliae]MCU8586775.1 DNA adenine methylase [Erwinia pyrifoliae]UWS30654.1 DNA adenine methylase [Erwinia pyrifoliae]UWS32124.1 DNA adenine methylase [Erwinia pyrifoliae]UXK13665.1 DNA adenine methylase [Erwinia pyrifoliae]